jgi:hypothetical protein
MMARKELSGGPAFDSLMGKLIQVPKRELDRRLAKRKQRKARRKKK